MKIAIGSPVKKSTKYIGPMRRVSKKTSQRLRKLPVTSHLESQVKMSVCPVLSWKANRE